MSNNWTEAGGVLRKSPLPPPQDTRPIVLEHLRCRRPLLWALVGVALMGLTSWLAGVSVWGASLAADVRVNDSKHQQLDNTLQELRSDVKELLRRTAAGKLTAEVGP